MTQEPVQPPCCPLRDARIWRRGLFMLLFAFLWSVGEVVLGAVAVLQFGWVLFTGAPNSRLLAFGSELARWFYQIFLYLTFVVDDRPWPFAPWPGAARDAGTS